MSALTATVTICNQKGLHARAAAKFVRLAENYAAEIKVQKDGMSVGATSILGLMMLVAAKGTELTLVAEGKDATEALKAIADLVARRFDESE